MSHILHLDASARPGLAGTDHHGSHWSCPYKTGHTFSLA